MLEDTKTLTEGQLAYKRMLESTPELALYGGDPDCNHEEISAGWSGVKCKYCPAWFCF